VNLNGRLGTVCGPARVVAFVGGSALPTRIVRVALDDGTFTEVLDTVAAERQVVARASFDYRPGDMRPKRRWWQRRHA